MSAALCTGGCFFFLLIMCFAALIGAAARHPPVHHKLSLDFYAKTCPQIDQLVDSVTGRRFRDSPASAPGTLRLFFHDCFVEGCDGSVLIAESTGAAAVEREAAENKNLAPEAFETVREAKAAVEGKCPGVVSCADILAVAARDFVHLAGGPYYEVKKGRRDSKTSRLEKVSRSLPRANSTVDDLIRLFSTKGLGIGDLVALSGGHTIGFSHCDQFVSRLYDFSGSGAGPVGGHVSPPGAPTGVSGGGRERRRDGAGGRDDAFEFDGAYYANLVAGMGLLATDQALFSDRRTKPMVTALAGNKTAFFEAFAAGMDRMGSFRVKKGSRSGVTASYTTKGWFIFSVRIDNQVC